MAAHLGTGQLTAIRWGAVPACRRCPLDHRGLDRRCAERLGQLARHSSAGARRRWFRPAASRRPTVKRRGCSSPCEWPLLVAKSENFCAFVWVAGHKLTESVWTRAIGLACRESGARRRVAAVRLEIGGADEGQGRSPIGGRIDGGAEVGEGSARERGEPSQLRDTPMAPVVGGDRQPGA